MLLYSPTRSTAALWSQMKPPLKSGHGKSGEKGPTEEQQTVVLVQEPLGDVSSDEDRVRAGKLRQQAAHLQLEALRLARTCHGREHVSPHAISSAAAIFCISPLVAWTFSSSLQYNLSSETIQAQSLVYSGEAAPPLTAASRAPSSKRGPWYLQEQAPRSP